MLGFAVGLHPNVQWLQYDVHAGSLGAGEELPVTFDFLVDGQFGRGTYNAITDFQQELGRAATGVLTNLQRQELSELAGRENSRLGMEQVSDERAHVTLMLPARLLTIRNPTESGTSYVSADGEFSLETMHAPLVETSFELRQKITQRWSGVAFIDAGAIGTDKTPRREDFRAGAGVGIRYDLGFGPIRADIAAPLGRRKGDPAFQIYLSIGQSF